MDRDFEQDPQIDSDALLNLEGRKRVSEDRFPEGAGVPKPWTLGTSSRSVCCSKYSYDSSAASNSGARLEAATHSARQKISDNSIHAPRITNNNVVILSILLSSQRAAPKTDAILGKSENCSSIPKPPLSQSATSSSYSWALRRTDQSLRRKIFINFGRCISRCDTAS